MVRMEGSGPPLPALGVRKPPVQKGCLCNRHNRLQYAQLQKLPRVCFV